MALSAGNGLSQLCQHTTDIGHTTSVKDAFNQVDQYASSPINRAYI